LNGQWVIEEIGRKFFLKFLETNENENTIYQNLWNTTMAVLVGNFITMSASIKRIREKFQINNLIMHLKLLYKQEQAKPQIGRQKEITKIKAELNERETKRTLQRINEKKVSSLKR
jgi:hypothetical protein